MYFYVIACEEKTLLTEIMWLAHDFLRHTWNQTDRSNLSVLYI